MSKVINNYLIVFLIIGLSACGSGGSSSTSNSDADADNDLIVNKKDNCANVSNASQADNDNDGYGDACDDDDDNDGVSDLFDDFPLDASRSVDIDTDGDGVGDSVDVFVLNPYESVDTDADGIGNNADPDDDNDSVYDEQDEYPLDPTRVSSIESAHRLLQQASFGFNVEELEEVVSLGVNAWIDEQLNAPSAYDNSSDNHKTHLERTIEIALQTDPSVPWYETSVFNQGTSSAFLKRYQMSAWWENALGHPDLVTQGSDQLRQRVAYALSQLFVVSAKDSFLTMRPESIASYYDILARNAFANFRTILGDVARSSAMGIYLTYHGNSKANLSTGNQPDENFAREVMQLFTIGLYQLNLDGSPDTDGNSGNYPDTGDDLNPVYTQDDVTELAKIMTGWDVVGNKYYGQLAHNTGDFTQPMEFTASKHEDESAYGGDGLVTLLGIEMNLSSGADGSGLDAALDILFNHQNVAPFISKQLILRLVSSNPSSNYVARVASIFNDNGNGVRGDLHAVVEAILKDPEARNSVYAALPDFGKAKEPILAFAQFLKAFNVKPLDGWPGRDGVTVVNGVYRYNWPEKHMGYAPMRANHVFNFYSPDYKPSNSYFSSHDLVAPELQVQGMQMLLEYNNNISEVVNKYEKNRITLIDETTPEDLSKDMPFWMDSLFLLDFSNEIKLFEIALDGDSNGDFTNMELVNSLTGVPYKDLAIDELINHLDSLLLGNTMTLEYRAGLKNYLVNSVAMKNKNKLLHVWNIVKDAVRFIVTSSAYMIQK